MSEIKNHNHIDDLCYEIVSVLKEKHTHIKRVYVRSSFVDVDESYNGVKAGKKDYDVTNVKDVMQNMIERGAETLVLGCTELPVAVDMYKLNFNVCDPTLELARGAIKAANGKCI